MTAELPKNCSAESLPPGCSAFTGFEYRLEESVGTTWAHTMGFNGIETAKEFLEKHRATYPTRTYRLIRLSFEELV